MLFATLFRGLGHQSEHEQQSQADKDLLPDTPLEGGAALRTRLRVSCVVVPTFLALHERHNPSPCWSRYRGSGGPQVNEPATPWLSFHESNQRGMVCCN